MKTLLLLAILFVSIFLGLPGVTNAEYDEVETLYQHLIARYRAGEYEKAEHVAKIIMDRMDYKDVKEIYNAIQSRLSGDERSAREWEAKWEVAERERNKADRERKAALIEKLDKEVRAIPAEQVEKNLELYERLLRLDPNNPRYKSKVAYYSKRLDEKRERARKREAAERERARKREKKYIRHYNYEHTNDYTVGVGFYTSDMKSLPKETRENYIGVLYLYIYAHDSCHVWGNFQLQQDKRLYDPNQFLGEIYQKNHSLKPGVIEPVIMLIPDYLDVGKPITIWIDEDTKKEFILTDFPHE